MVQCQRGDGQGEDVTFHQRRRQKRPGEHERQLRHERQVGNDDVGVFSPLSVSDCCAEEGLRQQNYQDGAGDGRDV